MKLSPLPYIIEEFKNNEWCEVSRPTVELYAKAQSETMAQSGRSIRVIYEGSIIFQTKPEGL